MSDLFENLKKAFEDYKVESYKKNADNHEEIKDFEHLIQQIALEPNGILTKSLAIDLFLKYAPVVQAEMNSEEKKADLQKSIDKMKIDKKNLKTHIN